MNLVESSVFGALNGLVTSALFLYLLSMVRPRLRLSTELALTSTDDGRSRYAFKVRNRSWFSLLEIQAKASFSPALDARGQRVGSGTRLALEYPELFDLGGREWRRTARGASTFVFYFEGPDPESLEPHSHWVIRVGVSSRHVLSQFGGVAKRNYVGSASVKRGAFAPGISLEIIESAQREEGVAAERVLSGE